MKRIAPSLLLAFSASAADLRPQQVTVPDSSTGAPVNTGDTTNKAQRVNIVTASGGVAFDISDRVARVLGHIICDSGCGGAASFSDNSAFTAGTSAINISGGVFNDGLAAVTSGNAAAPRITSFRALHF